MMNPLTLYQRDVFNKLKIHFPKGSKILDAGCGKGQDVLYMSEEFDCQVVGIDPVKDEHWDKIKNKNIQFKVGSILKLPFLDNQFDYVFLKDVLHHVDEGKNRPFILKKALLGIERVTKIGGKIIIVEANRANPIFYFHMTLIKGHNHFKRSYFRKLIQSCFKAVEFRAFESHVYPKKLVKLFKMYEKIMEKISFLNPLLSYNVAVIKIT